MRNIRSGARAISLLLVPSVLVFGLYATSDVAQAQTEEQCIEWNAFGRCIKTVPVPVGTPVTSPGSSVPGGGPSVPLPNCRWRTIPTIPGIEAWIGPPPPGMEDPVLQGYQCDELPEGVAESPALGLPVAFRWVDGGAAPTPPAPSVVAALLYARVETLMRAPAVEASPPTVDPAVVKTPVFVAVDNWQGVLTDSECVLGTCVTMTATPSLEFDPGEDGAPVVGCAGSGTRWDPNGATPDVQAGVPGACVWEYSKVSGLGDRPDEWASSVTVRWTVEWATDDGATRGTFPALTFTTDVPRLVNEVQTVVADNQ